MVEPRCGVVFELHSHEKTVFFMIGTSAMIEYDWVGIEKVLQYCYIVGIYALVRRTVCEDYSGQHI